MSGLDKIIGQILADAENEAEVILGKAKEEAAGLLDRAKEEIQKLEADAEEAKSRKRAAYMDRVKSSADLKRRQAVLETKQQMIADILEKAYEKLLSKGDEEYFAILKKMLDRFVLAKEGEIYFSQKDLDRMPESFRAEIEKSAKEKGGSLTLGKEPRRIDGGFILVYGGVEENCTFRALFAERKDELSDKVHAMLFL